jgi:hypothetical protein
MYIFFLLFCFLLGPCILAGYLCIHIRDVQTLDFVYMVFMVYGLYLCLCLWVVYGLCLWIAYMASVWIVFEYTYESCLGICMDMCLWIVWVYVWTSGLDPSQGSVQQTSGLTPP